MYLLDTNICIYIRRAKPPHVHMLIAAHALSLGTTLVTNNLGEFKCVTGLQAENWV